VVMQLQEAPLAHLARLCQQLMLNDKFRVVLVTCSFGAWILLVLLLIFVSATLACGSLVKGVPVARGAVPCQQHWHQVQAINGVAGVHTIYVNELMLIHHGLGVILVPFPKTRRITSLSRGFVSQLER
jgi:hypothetical protein